MIKYTLVILTLLFSLTLKSQNYIPEICEVYIDSSINKNVVSWNLPDTINSGKVNIYKNSGSENNYIKIDEVVWDIEQFTDYVSNPSEVNERYKISYEDINNNESQLSNYHQTILLQVSEYNSNLQLNWDEYKGRNVRKYYIYRGSAPNNILLYDSVNAFVNFYNINNVGSNYYFGVDAVFEDSCSDGFLTTINAYYQVKSTKEIVNTDIMLSPNPTNDYLNIDIYNPDNLDFDVQIINNFGVVVKALKINNNSKIFVGDLIKGIYTVKLTGFYYSYRKIIIY